MTKKMTKKEAIAWYQSASEEEQKAHAFRLHRKYFTQHFARAVQHLTDYEPTEKNLAGVMRSLDWSVVRERERVTPEKIDRAIRYLSALRPLMKKQSLN